MEKLISFSTVGDSARPMPLSSNISTSRAVSLRQTRLVIVDSQKQSGVSMNLRIDKFSSLKTHENVLGTSGICVDEESRGRKKLKTSQWNLFFAAAAKKVYRWNFAILLLCNRELLLKWKANFGRYRNSLNLAPGCVDGWAVKAEAFCSVAQWRESRQMNLKFHQTNAVGTCHQLGSLCSTNFPN